MNTPRTLKSAESAETIRLTIPVSKEVHETFQRLAKASGMSVGRSMGDWLGDTLEAAEFMAVTMEKARAAPKLVIQELQAYTLGLSDELSDVMAIVRRKGEQERAAAVAAGQGPRLRGEGPGATAAAQEVAAIRRKDGQERVAVSAAAQAPRLVIRGGKSTTDKTGPRGKKA